MAGQTNTNQGPMVDEDDAFAAAFGALGFGIVLTLVLGRMRRRFARRREAPALARGGARR